MQKGEAYEKEVAVCCCLAVAAFAYLVVTAPLPKPPASFQGTYETYPGPWQILFSVNGKDGEFYYTDRDLHKYIVGDIEPLGDNRYAISCRTPDSAAWIPDQTIVHENDGGSNSFYAEINGAAVITATRPAL